MVPLCPSMTLDDFKRTLPEVAPAPGLAAPLAALWWAGKGDWHRAHDLAQDGDEGAHAWVHAYLHRLEGDLGNARYWYRRAGREPASGPCEEEWETIVTTMLRGED